MRSRDTDVIVAGAGAVVCAAVVLTVGSVAVRAIFAVPLCLLLPGYTITAAVFARQPLTALNRCLLVPSLSIATLVLGAVVLDLAPTGLTTNSWAAWLVLVVLGGVAGAVLRRAEVAPDGATGRSFPRPSLMASVMLLIAAMLASGSIALSRVVLPAANAVGYTQLWMLSTGTPQAPSVQIGLRSAEKQLAAYRLLLSSGTGRPQVVFAKLVLRPGGSVVETVPLSGLAGPESIVTARLYRFGSGALYRYVTAVVASGPRSGSLTGRAQTRRAAGAATR